MARNIDDELGPSPFPRNAGLDAMTQLNQGLQNILPMIMKMKQMKQDQMPLGDYLGGVPQSGLPQGLQQFWSTPVGRLRGLSDALGGSMASLVHPQPPTMSLFFDPKTGGFSPTQTPDSTPVPGLKPGEAARALKKPSGGPSYTPQQVMEVVNGVKKGNVDLLNKASAFGGGFKNAIIAELAHQGVDVTSMNLDRESKAAYVKTVNGPAFQNTIKFLGSVKPSMDTVDKLADKVALSFPKPINKAQLMIMVNSKSKEAAQFAAAALEVQDQVAKILQGGGTGSATSDAKLKQADLILSKDYDVKTFKAVTQTMRELLANREAGMRSNTLIKLSENGAPKKTADQRFSELIASGKSKQDAFKIMHGEGY